MKGIPQAVDTMEVEVAEECWDWTRIAVVVHNTALRTEAPYLASSAYLQPVTQDIRRLGRLDKAWPVHQAAVL